MGGREKLGWEEEGETLIGIYCVRKKTIYNERKKFHDIHVIYHLLNIKAIFHTEKMFL